MGPTRWRRVAPGRYNDPVGSGASASHVALVAKLQQQTHTRSNMPNNSSLTKLLYLQTYCLCLLALNLYIIKTLKHFKQIFTKTL